MHYRTNTQIPIQHQHGFDEVDKFLMMSVNHNNNTDFWRVSQNRSTTPSRSHGLHDYAIQSPTYSNNFSPELVSPSGKSILYQEKPVILLNSLINWGL